MTATKQLDATNLYFHLSTTELAHQLRQIKERIQLLRHVYATTLSSEISNQIEQWRAEFKARADVLLDREGGPDLVYELVRGQEAFFLSPSKPTGKPTIPLQVQEIAELVWWVNQQQPPAPPKRSVFGDGLDQFVS